MSASENIRPTAHDIAADWLQRLDHPNVQEAELQSWLEWFGHNDENRRAFEEVQALRRRFRAVAPEHRAGIRERLGLAAPARVNRRPTWALAAGVAALAMATAVWWGSRSSLSEHVYSATTNQHRTVQLTDGSALVLAADAVVAVHYTAERRGLNIERGAAYFEVRHNPARPFVVEAAGIRVTAIGTAFNVQRSDSHVIVTVTEGVVEVSSGDGVPPARLAVGQRLERSVHSGRLEPGADAEHQGIQWRDGRADFVDAPLRDVLAFVNQYVPARLAIDDPRVADMTYSGTILRAHLDEWVVSLPRVYPVRAVPLEDGTVTLVSRRD